MVYSSAAESALDLYSETFWDSSLVSAMSFGLLVRRGGGDLLADFLLLGASLFEGLQRLTTCGVGGEHFVDEPTDSPRLRWDSLTISVCSRMN